MSNLSPEKIEEIKKLLISKGANNVHYKNEHYLKFIFDFTVNNEDLKLCLSTPYDEYWTFIPSIRILNKNIPALDHIGNDGLVCTTDHQGENFDLKNHHQLINFVFDRAIEIIDRSLTTCKLGQRRELYNELEGYLSTIDNSEHSIQLHVDPENHENIYGWIQQHPTKNFLFILKHLTSSDTNNFSHLIGSNLTKVKVDKILLSDADFFPIPNIGEDFDEAYFQNLINNLSDEEKIKLTQKGQHIVLVGVPNKHGYAYIVFTYFVWSFYKSGLHLINFRLSLVQRAWREYLLNRSGQQEINQHIGIIGCGSLGSRVADFLVQMGVKEISLIDNDILKTDNVYRHSLGITDVNKPKVIALSQKLTNERPGIKVNSFYENGLKWISTDSVFKIDTLILATGHLPTEIFITKKIYDLEIDINIISAWLEPYDLGGHIISFSSNNEGCLNCLLYNKNGNKTLYPQTSYVLKGQHIAKNITGCAGAFTPFSSLSGIKIASLICEVIVDDFKGLKSVTGNINQISELKISVSEYWNQVDSTNGYLDRSLSEIKAIGCVCCNI